jgi:hypothetical protein
MARKVNAHVAVTRHSPNGPLSDLGEAGLTATHCAHSRLPFRIIASTRQSPSFRCYSLALRLGLSERVLTKDKPLTVREHSVVEALTLPTERFALHRSSQSQSPAPKSAATRWSVSADVPTFAFGLARRRKLPKPDSSGVCCAA